MNIPDWSTFGTKRHTGIGSILSSLLVFFVTVKKDFVNSKHVSTGWKGTTFIHGIFDTGYNTKESLFLHIWQHICGWKPLYIEYCNLKKWSYIIFQENRNRIFKFVKIILTKQMMLVFPRSIEQWSFMKSLILFVIYVFLNYCYY